MALKTKKIIISSVLLFAVAAAAVAFYMYNKGPVDVKHSKGISVNAPELYNFFSIDSVMAAKRYSGKILRVTGEVSEVSSNAQGQKIVLLKTASPLANINCTLEEAVENIKPSDKLSIKGICSGIGEGDADLGIQGDVYLARAYVAE